MRCSYYLPGKIKLFPSVWSTTRKSVLHLIVFFWESKMESFSEAASKGTCFSLYLERWKLFIQLFWPLSFTMVVKKNTFSVEFRLPWKKNLEKSDVVKNELRVESLKARVKIQKCDFKSTSHEFKFTSYEFNFRSCEFKSRSCEFKSTSSRIF